MNKYKIEGGIDFFAELYKSLDIEENEQKTDEDNNKCLITNQNLTTYYVTMSCGHKFNYIPLYKDLINHKQKFNNMEGEKSRLSSTQIRCPYCRKKQNELLPYYEELELKKIHGVNFYDPTAKNIYSSYNGTKCSYQIPNPIFDETKPESETNKKFYACNYSYATQINLYNPSNPSQPLNYGDEECYCYAHKKIMIKQYKAQEKLKAKDEAKLAKLAKQKAKDEAKAAKDLEKQKLKEEKQKAKEEAKAAKKKKVENVVLGPSSITIEPTVASLEPLPELGCVQILKTGPNKGKQCGCSIKSENLCLRHFKIVNNIIINN